MNKTKRSFTAYVTTVLAAFAFISLTATSYASQELISLFPLDNYDQTISNWVKPEDPVFDKPLLSADMQQKRLNIFYDHYFGSLSPWNMTYVKRILQQRAPDDLKTIEQSLIDYFSNEGKSSNRIGYGENFRAYTSVWIKEIANNINLSQFNQLSYQVDHRGIAIDNLHARVLPTNDVHFYSHKLAGQGYPFDNLQMSALWAGTPVYMVAETRDRAWVLVITPDYVGWVKRNGIAKADSNFINAWASAAKKKLAAITHTKTSLIDKKGNFLLSAYVGSVFPVISDSSDIEIMVPSIDSERHARIKHVVVSSANIAPMPIAVTAHNFSNMMQTTLGRPYGWGSMYFYNDCSAELKSLFTPFGIWLPRHSSNQVTVGKMVDMSMATKEKRLSYLIENGQRFLTLIYIGGHVVMYIGNYPNPHDASDLMAMTYQNIWGMRSNVADGRIVIGKSVLFPMLLSYPEDSSLRSLASTKYFQVSYLNQLPDTGVSIKAESIDLKSLMYSEALFNELYY